MPGQKQRMTTNQSMTPRRLVVGLLLGAVLLSGGAWVYQSVEAVVSANVRKGLASILRREAGVAREWIDRQLALAAEIASSTATVRALQEAPGLPAPASDGPPAAASLIEAGLLSAVQLSDMGGRTVFGHGLIAPTPASIANGGLRSWVDTTPPERPGLLYVAAPVIDDGRRLGELTIAVSLQPLHRQLQLGRFGETGETHLVEPHGALISTPRFAGEAPGLASYRHPLVSAQPQADAVWPGIQLRMNGYTDYRGRSVLAAWTDLDTHDLMLVTELDTQEAMGALATLQRGGLTLFGILAAGPALLFVFWPRIGGYLRSRRAQQAELSRLNAELQSARSRFDVLFEHVAIGLVLTNDQGAIVTCNSEMGEMLGYTVDELCAMDCCEFTFPGDVVVDSGLIERLQRTATGSMTIEKRYVRRDGQTIWVLVTLSLVPHADGQVYTLAMVQDISDLKQTNLELSDARKRLQIALESTSLGVWYWDVAADRVEWDRSTCRLLGFEQDRWEGNGMGALLRCPGEDMERVRDELLAAIRGSGSQFAIDCPVIRFDNRRIEATFRGDIERDRQGRAVRVIGSILDVTANRAAQRELERARDQAEAGNRSKSAFIANMSHEIRTPLNAIMGFAQVGHRDETLEPEQRRRSELILRSSEHLLQLVNDVLDLSKIEAGRLSLSRERFDLHALINELDRTWSMRAHSRGLGWRVARSDAVPQWVSADPLRVQQVLTNLLDNAVRFTEKGWVALEVDAEQLPEGELQLVVEVRDTGPGIPEADQERIFERFEQGGSGRTWTGGTGLGLAIGREIARLMNGDLAVVSRAGCGSVFRATFKVPSAAPATAPDAADGSRDHGRAGARLLVIDDEPHNRLLLRQMLEPLGFTVTEAADGREALESLGSGLPDIILLDLRLPQMDGLAFLAHLRRQQLEPRPWVIALAASESPGDQQAALDAGADAFLTRPLRRNDLLACLRQGAGVRVVPSLTEDDAELPLTSAGTARSLPAEVRAAMQEALVRGDVDQLLSQAGAMAQEDADLARTIRQYAETFDFERLEALLAESS